jgi:RNA 3'-terminal phosphate cyclase (ATP)
MLTIDGSQGEGGGQILRTSLGLSMCLHRPVRIINIRAARRQPGLRPQHLAAVQAAVTIAGANIDGNTIGSRALTFVPGENRSGMYRFDIGTAGSTTLVLQTVLPALLTGVGASHLTLIGGTHNPLAPPFEFMQHAFVPLINRMGAKIATRLHQPGYFPAGGGVLDVRIEPATQLAPLQLLDRGAVHAIRARATVAHLPEHIARRELAVLKNRLDLDDDDLRVHVETQATGPGNVVSVTITCEHITEVFTGFGERGVRAETVAQRLAHRVQRYLAADVAVGEHLADQLLIPMALTGEGAFLTLRPSRHAVTNMDVIRRFMDVRIEQHEVAPDRWRVELR